MAVERVEPLPDRPGFVEYHDDGSIVCKDEAGVFISHELNYRPPGVMSALKDGRNKRRSAPVLAEVQQLLDTLPPELVEDPREGWIIRHLAAALVTGGAGSASIARELIQRLGLPASQTMRRPAEGEKCPTCGRIYWRDNPIPKELLRDLLGDLRILREQDDRLKSEREQEAGAESPL